MWLWLKKPSSTQQKLWGRACISNVFQVSRRFEKLPRLVTAAGHRGLLRTPANRGDSYGGEGEGVERNSGSSSLRAPILKGRFFARTNQIW